ncbi:ABC transporter permease [Janthinobacterium sp. 78]|uniref:ABC transporter permease n=1 Tax=Janthinobacterium sp. 78 TaxID=2135631 RepID=UPI000D5C653E|nr:ABC transporter permease [Janthinobacterium sp. 78]PVX38621.1 FtsX-like permease family protein [Janthinobacterium sp. 78]
MKAADFRIGWRLMAQQRGASAAVILGLAVGFAACFLLLGFVGYSLGYDSQVPQRERVLLVKQRINLFIRPEWQNFAYLSLRDVARRSGAVGMASIVKELDVPVQRGERPYALNVQAVDADFASLFGVTALQGDLRSALAQPDAVALTQTAARKLFADASALGQLLQIGGVTLKVRAILPDHQRNTSVPYEVLVGTLSSAWPAAQREAAFAGTGRGAIYLQLRPGADPGALAALLQQAVNDSPQDRHVRGASMGRALAGRNVTDIALLPLAQAYFDADLYHSRAAARHGQRASVVGLAVLALLILALAVINYVNLATVRTLRRQREIGVRKLLGAGAARLVRQFLAESVLTALLAAAAGLLLAWLALPLFAELVQRPLDDMFTAWRCAGALLFGVLTGLCAGVYPAWCALRVRPGPALAGRGNSETAAGLWLRRVLTVLQFGAAMALCAATLAVGWQSWYGSHASPGFMPDGLLVLDLPPGSEDSPQARAFEEALARLPGIGGVAGIAEAVGRDGSKVVGSVRTRDGRDVRLEYKPMTPGWFALHRIVPLHGRLFDAAQDRIGSQVVVLNAAAALALGYPTPQAAVGQAMPDGQVIIGIAPPIRFQDMRQAAQPMLFDLRHGGALSLRSNDDVAAAHARIEPLWQRYFPQRMLELRTAQSLLAQMYAEDLRLARMLGLASLIAMLLAAFGIYVLSAYSVQRRSREIVLRKLHGAGRAAIARLVGREFMLLLAAGAVLGLPLAALGIARYLAGFVERAPVGAWPLAAALLLAMLVALLATVRHTWSAMRMAPAQALRD